ncbi:MAG: hypothetical protein EXR99_04830 [Gemmataceae bacterium]|nr:hypothetical protein [Gemmataceae bacterium]
MLLAALVSLSCQVSFAEEPKKAADSLVVYQGAAGPGLGKHIVLVSGDEEYRSEEALPQLGKILAKHHGFTCTVLFAIDLKTGLINPNQNDNIPGLENLAKADLMIIGTRMRKLPPEQMKPIEDYLLAGKPVIGLRTATHAFLFSKEHPFARYGNGYRGESKEWEGGFGRLVLGEMWINHHGSHGKESCRGVLAPMKESHPIVKGIQDGDIWGPTDVYGVRLPLPDDSQPLILGQVLNGMKSTDKPVEGKKNDPMMPVAWVKSYQLPGGKKGKSFNTTMGASQDFESEGLRRLVVNASYWCLDMGAKVPEKSKVDLVGKYEPTRFSFNGHKKGMKPSDFAGLD